MVFPYANKVSFAVPASSETVTISASSNSQYSGNTIVATLKGDETHSWYTTQEGYSIQQDASGDWKYLNSDGNTLTFSSTSAFSTAPAGLQKNNQLSEQSLRGIISSKNKLVLENKESPIDNKLHHLVILAAFSDHWNSGANQIISTYSNSLTPEVCKTQLTNYMNSTFTPLQFNFTVTKWIQLPNTQDHYGKDSLNQTDLNINSIVQDSIDSLIASSNTSEINSLNATLSSNSFSSVTIIHSGKNQANASYSTSGNLVWSRHGIINPNIQISNTSTLLKNYITIAAQTNDQSNQTLNLGVYGHEFGHLLGLPDLYTYSSNTPSIGVYGLMGYGAWGKDISSSSASSPSSLHVWSKKQLGLITPTKILASQNNLILNDSSIHQVINSTSTSEYFLLEFQKNKGMLIWHIYENAFSSTISELNHPIAFLEEADNNLSLANTIPIEETGDYWNQSNFHTSFSDNTFSSNVNSRLYQDNYISRTSTGNTSTHISIQNIHYNNSYIEYDLRTLFTTIYLNNPEDDFSSGTFSWHPVSGANIYSIFRSTDATNWTFTSNVSTTTFSDNSNIQTNLSSGIYYAIETNQGYRSETYQYGIRSHGGSLDFEKQLLTLNFNSSIDISYSTLVNLEKIHFLNYSGNALFNLNTDTSTFNYPAQTTQDITILSSGNELKQLQIQLSPPQLYHIVENLDTANPKIYLELDSGTLKNLQGIESIKQTGYTLSVNVIQDNNAPQLKSSSRDNDLGTIQLEFTEKILPNSLSTKDFIFLNDSNLFTSIGNATYTITDNTLSIQPTGKEHLRGLIIGDNQAFHIKFPSSVITDISKNKLASNQNDLLHYQVSPTIIPDQKPPILSTYTINNRDETRLLKLNFTEPIFSDTSKGSNFTKDHFNLNVYSAHSDPSPVTLSANQISLIQESDTFANQTFIVTTGVQINITPDQVESIDNHLGIMVFPAPTIYMAASGLGLGFYDWQGNRSDDTIVASENYTPRKRLRLTKPDKPVRWRGSHVIAWNLNGGWYDSDRLDIEWWTIENTTKVLTDNFKLASGNTGIYQAQYTIWDSTKDSDRTDYHVRIYEEGRRDIIYSSSPSIHIDNTRPDVEISYLSPNSPTTRPNAISVFDDETDADGNSIPNDTRLPVNKNDNANIVIVATFSENVIEPPLLKIFQQGSVDIIGPAGNGISMTTANGSQHKFFYPYDINTQDGSNYIDGEAIIEISSVPDTAIGDNLLFDAYEDLVGNLTKTPTSNLSFLIDTIPPTIASLDFLVADESIVEQPTTLILYFSESIYDPSLPATGIFNKDNYSFSGADSENLSITDISLAGTNGRGPYRIVLSDQIRQGTISVIIDSRKVRDFHFNEMGIPSIASATWPGPLTNLTPVIVSPFGKTRLLLQGGYPPYSYKIHSFYHNIATIDSADNKSVFAKSLGQYMVEITESRNQTRYVNTTVLPPTFNTFNKELSAYRDELDYHLTSFPFNLEQYDGKSLIELLKDPAGTFNVDYVLYSYSPDKNGYFIITEKTTQVGPGFGFWMASRLKRNIDFERSGPLENQVIGIDLHHGWNLIGNPFNKELPISHIYVSTNANRFEIADIKQSETAHNIWYTDITLPGYVSIESIPPNKAAWLYINNKKGAEIIFHNVKEDPLYPQDFEPLNKLNKHRSLREAAGEPSPPARPGSPLFGSNRKSGSGSGGGGCFISINKESL